MFRLILTRGWYPALITAIAVVGLILSWSINIVVPILVVILFAGLIAAIIIARKNELELQSMKLTQHSAYFHRRFMGNSSLSIFSVIDSLYSLENPKIWDWARACSMSQRIFNTWSDSFITRVESDLRSRRYTIFLHTHLNELWSINNHYFEFVEQFCEIVDKYEVPQESIDQYNRFVAEYNVFVKNFQDTISELRSIARTQIEAPSVKLAQEIHGKR